MISILRGAEPSELGRLKGGDRYGHENVRWALRDMQKHKCCYCEDWIPEEGPNQQVEHYRPRESAPELKFTWSNLLIACGRCNNKKSNKFPKFGNGRPIIIDPSDTRVDPEKHITFLGGGDTPKQLMGRCVAVNSSRRGTGTIEIIDLDGDDPVSRRTAHYRNTLYHLLGKLLRAKHEGDATRFSEAQEDLAEQMSGQTPLAGFSRAWARNEGIHTLGVAIPSGP